MMLFTFAARILQRHWIRSALSIIGIVIGVIAIASLGIMGNSINLLVANIITDVGDTIVITPHTAIGGTFAGDPRDRRQPRRRVLSCVEGGAAEPHRSAPLRVTGFYRMRSGGGKIASPVQEFHTRGDMGKPVKTMLFVL